MTNCHTIPRQRAVLSTKSIAKIQHYSILVAKRCKRMHTCLNFQRLPWKTTNIQLTLATKKHLREFVAFIIFLYLLLQFH